MLTFSRCYFLLTALLSQMKCLQPFSWRPFFSFSCSPFKSPDPGCAPWSLCPTFSPPQEVTSAVLFHKRSKDLCTHSPMCTASTPLLLNCHLAFEMLLGPREQNLQWIFLALILLDPSGAPQNWNFFCFQIFLLITVPTVWISPHFSHMRQGVFSSRPSSLPALLPTVIQAPPLTPLPHSLLSKHLPLSTTHPAHSSVAFCLSDHFRVSLYLKRNLILLF